MQVGIHFIIALVCWIISCTWGANYVNDSTLIISSSISSSFLINSPVIGSLNDSTLILFYFPIITFFFVIHAVSTSSIFCIDLHIPDSNKVNYLAISLGSN